MGKLIDNGWRKDSEVNSKEGWTLSVSLGLKPQSETESTTKSKSLDEEIPPEILLKRLEATKPERKSFKSNQEHEEAVNHWMLTQGRTISLIRSRLKDSKKA